jgi:LysM repeat protein
MPSKLIRAALACGTLSAVMLLGSCSSSSKKAKQAEEEAKMAGDLFDNRGGRLAAPLVKPVSAEFGEAPVLIAPPAPLPAPAKVEAAVAPAPTPAEEIIPLVAEPVKPVTPKVTAKTTVATSPKFPVTKSGSTYSIQKGDILGRIAQDHGVKTADLLAANPGVDPARLKVGQKIKIPAAGFAKTKPAPLAGTAKSSKPSVKPSGKSSSSKSSGAVKSSGGEYTVVSGDFPEKIAKKLGVKQADLMAANPGLNATGLQIGQKLKVPGASSGSSAGVSSRSPADPADVGGDIAPAPAPAPAVAVGETAPAPAVDLSNTEPISYTTVPGDTLDSLAAGMGSTVALIKAANPSIKSDADLKPNMSITVPVPR